MLKLFVYGIILSLAPHQTIADGVRTAPDFSSYMAEFCSNRPYDCLDNGIVTGYLVNTFLYEFYLEVEDFFVYQGFDSAEFEFCRSSDCQEEGVTVKNSKYKITKMFPSKKEFFGAFGGLNRNLGVYFSRALTESQANNWCSVEVRSGNRLSRAAQRAIDDGNFSLWNLRALYYQEYTVSLAQYLPQINALDPKDVPLATECWLRHKKKRIVFESKEGTS